MKRYYARFTHLVALGIGSIFAVLGLVLPQRWPASSSSTIPA